MKLRVIRYLWIGLLCLAVSIVAYAEMPQQPEGKVNDFANVLDASVKAALNTLIAQVESAKGAQLAVVTVKSLDGLTVEEYANRLFNLWGIGNKGKDDGILFLIAPVEHKVRIEVGYGLESLINDAKAGRILDEAVVPHFKAGEYGQGILAGSERIAAVIMHDESLIKTIALPQQLKGEPLFWQIKAVMIGYCGLFVVLGFMAVGVGMHGNKNMLIWGLGFGGVPLLLSFVFSYVMDFSMFIIPGWALLVLIISVIFGKKISKVFGKTNNQWGSSSGGFRSGSSFSGFGGGSSGGGGSSRSW